MPGEGDIHPQFSGCRWAARYGTYICDDGYDVNGQYSIEDLERTYAGGLPTGGELTGGAGIFPRADGGLGPTGYPSFGGQVAGSGLGPGLPGQRNPDADDWGMWAAQGPFNILSPAVDSIAAAAPSSGTLAKVALATGLSLGAVQIGLIAAGVLVAVLLVKSK